MTEKIWVWIETTSGMSCVDVASIIGITHTHDKFGHGCYDLHLTSGTIFTIRAGDLNTITSNLPNWVWGDYGDEE